MSDRSIVLGTMILGSTVDQDTSFAILDSFTDLGGTVLDTANNYCFWLPGRTGDESETVVGAWLAQRSARDRVQISTKVGARPAVPGSSDPADWEGLSPRVVAAAVEDSLRRLHTEYIDVYWAHVEDRKTPLTDTVGAFADLVDAGTVGAIGASNHALWRVEQARAIAGERPRFSLLQLRNSYLQPRVDIPLPSSAHVLVTADTVDYSRSEGLPLWVYSPLLSGAYTRPDVALPAAYDHPGTAARLAALHDVAAETGATPNQVVLAWLLDNGMIPIVGVSSVAQVVEAMGARELVLASEHLAMLDSAATDAAASLP